MTFKITDFTTSAKKILEVAQSQAIQLGFPMIISENLLLAIIADSTSNAAIALKKYANTDELAAKIDRAIFRNQNCTTGSVTKLPFSPEIKTVLEDSFREMQNCNATAISVEHLLLGILRSPHCSAGMYLSFYGINYSMIKATLDKMTVVSSSATKSKTSSKSIPKSDSASVSCGAGCGCHSAVASVAQAATDAAAQVANSIPPSVKARFASLTDAVTQGLGVATTFAQNINDKSKARNEWIAVLDEAMKMAEATGVSIPAAFVQLSFANQSTVDKVFIQQLRQETIAEAIETLIKQTQ